PSPLLTIPPPAFTVSPKPPATPPTVPARPPPRAPTYSPTRLVSDLGEQEAVREGGSGDAYGVPCGIDDTLHPSAHGIRDAARNTLHIRDNAFGLFALFRWYTSSSRQFLQSGQ
ncbi:MAG: hypothetical protein Q9171_007165, partial [Xanthocarpia ochracea]